MSLQETFKHLCYSISVAIKFNVLKFSVSVLHQTYSRYRYQKCISYTRFYQLSEINLLKES